MKNLIAALGKYGKVETCEVVDRKLIIRITDGFENKPDNLYNMYRLIDGLTNKRYPLVSKMNVDKNNFYAELKERDPQL